MTSKAAALRYARALFDVALKEGSNLEQIETELAGFVSLFTEHPMLGKVLLNPAVPTPRKRAAVQQLVASLSITPVLAKLLTLLAERDRLIVLPDLVTSFRDRLLDHQQVVRAEVTTATPLSSEQAQEIGNRLGLVTKKRVLVSTNVDPAIIGGLVARIGSMVYDASVTHQLEKIRTRLVAGAQG